VQPRTRRLDDVSDLAQWIARARVHVAGLSAHDRWPCFLVERLPERLRDHPALHIRGHRNDAPHPEPEKSQCAVYRRMALRAE